MTEAKDFELLNYLKTLTKPIWMFPEALGYRIFTAPAAKPSLQRPFDARGSPWHELIMNDVQNLWIMQI